MRKMWTAVLTAGAVGTSVLATAAVASATDSSSGDRAGGSARTCVGTWDGSVQIGSVNRKLLLAFTKEGIVHVAEAAAQGSSVPGGADVEFNSPGLGAWRAGGGGCSLTVKILSNDSQGVDSGFATVSGTATPTAGKLSGTLSFTTTLPDGGGAGPLPVTFEGTRIVAP